jgi:soluble lytic murein transglycosylase-like protein
MAWVGMTIAALAAGAARADVYQIDEAGAVRVRPVAGAVQWVTPGEARAVAADYAAADDESGIPEAAMTLVGAPAVPDAWRASLQAAAQRYGISSDLLAALVSQESGWHPAATSAKGAVGLAQLMPATARALAVDARDPAANLAGGAQYLRRMLDTFDGDIERALAAYNAGPARVQRAGGVPAIAETRAYVSNILLRLSPADAGPTGIAP